MIALAALWANPLVRKIAIYGAIALAALYMMRLWGNRQWSKGETSGRVFMADQIEKQKKAEWEVKENAIAEAAASVAQEKQTVEAQRQLLARERANLSRTLKAGLEKIQNERIRASENIASVPDVALWDALREVSRELATINNR